MTRAKVLAIIAMGLVLVGLAASPVAADAPTTFDDWLTFTDLDPCTGLPQTIAIYVEGRLHTDHQNNFVAHVKRTGITDAGYVMDHGVESYQENENVARGSFTDIWRHDDGSKFKAQGVFVFNIGTGEVLVDNFNLTCIGK